MLAEAEIALLDEARRQRLTELLLIRRAQEAVRAAERAIAEVMPLLGGRHITEPVTVTPAEAPQSAGDGSGADDPAAAAIAAPAPIHRDGDGRKRRRGTKRCEECGGPFEPDVRVPGQKFCGTPCRRAFNDRKVQARRKEERQARRNGAAEIAEASVYYESKPEPVHVLHVPPENDATAPTAPVQPESAESGGAFPGGGIQPPEPPPIPVLSPAPRIATKRCPRCQDAFVPKSTIQRYCGFECEEAALEDRARFGLPPPGERNVPSLTD